MTIPPSPHPLPPKKTERPFLFFFFSVWYNKKNTNIININKV